MSDNKIVEIRNDSDLARLNIEDDRFEYKDSVGKEVLERLRASALHRTTTMCGRFTLSETLTNCFRQKNSILSPEDEELVKAAGNNAYISLTELKTSAAEGIFKDNIIAPGSLPFLVEPTPLPSLSEDGKKEAVKRLIQIAIESGRPIDEDYLIELAKTAKKQLLEQEKIIADEKAKNMNQLIRDQCEEGGYQDAMLDFIQDFVVYPYAVFEGPIVTFKEIDVWKGNKFTSSMEQIYTFRRVSPFDLYWTPDSTTTQDGTGVTVVERMPVHTLSQMLEHDSFIREAVELVMSCIDTGKLGRSWLGTSVSKLSIATMTRSDEVRQNSGVMGGSTIEVLRHYGVFNGKHLKDMGVEYIDRKAKKNLIEDHKFYECTATVIAGITVQLMVSHTTGQFKRPIHTASYEKRGAGIPGVALAQKLYDIERFYLSTLRNLVSNASYVSKPISEVDFSRIIKGVDPNLMLNVRPGQAVPTTSMGMNQGPAIRFYDIPSHIGEYSNLLQQVMDLADRITQLPAALHGEPVGTGANRTFRGVALLQGNVLKTIQTSTMNIDKYIHRPMGELLYRYNMMYSKDDSVKGDAQVVANGASTMLDKQVQEQKISNALMLVGNTGVGTPQLITYLVGRLLDDVDIPEHILNTMMAPVTMQGNTPPQEDNSEAAQLMAAGVDPQGAESVETSVAMTESDIIN